MKILYKYILIYFIIFSSLMAEAANTFKNPDFAFPQTVQANAEAELKKAVASGDASTAITALLQIATAKLNIDRASLADAIALSETTAAEFVNSDFAPIFHLLTARLYYKYYFNNSWTYDRRELPLEPRPSDISEWSGDQFKAVIADLCTKAAEGASKSLRNVPLSKGDQFLTYDKLSAEFYPSSFDFVLDASTYLMGSLRQSNEDVLAFFCRYATNPDGRPTEALWAYKKACWSPDPEAELRKSIDLDNPYSSLSLKAYAEKLSLSASDDYDEVSISEYGEVGVDEAPKENPVEKAANAVKLMREFLDKNPNAVFSEDIEQQIKRLCAASIRVKAPNITAPLAEMKIDVVNVNAKHFFINIFKLPSHIKQGRPLQTYLGNSNPIRRIEIDANIGASAPFRQDSTLSTTLPEPGRYVIVPSVPGQTKYDGWYSMVGCVPVLPLTITNVEHPAVIVSHPVTGEPIKGAAVSAFSRRATSEPVATDAFGVAFPNIVDGGDLRVKYKGASYDFESLPIHKCRTAVPDDKPYYDIAVMTDRAIYHPGDSVQFLAVTYAKQDKKQWLASGKKVRFVISDANDEPIDTIEDTTDKFGRAAGEVKLPANGLTGRFSIVSSIDDSEIDTHLFTVADYRMPEFELRDLVVANDTPAKGDVTVHGEAYTYSGMPVADCDVELVLSTASRWRWFSPQEKVFAAKATTDNAGRFSAVIPDSIFKEHPDTPYYIASISASAPNGSTAEASAPVVKGKPYVIQVAVANAESVNGEKPLVPKVEVFDPDGKAVTTPLLYTIKNSRSTVLSGEFPTESIDISSLTPGEYVLTIKPVNKEIADSVSTSFTVYNRATGLCPEGKTLFIIKGNTDIPADGRISISFAVPSESYLHYSVASGTKLDTLAMVKVGAGYHDLDITLPNGIDCADVTLFMVKDVRTAYQKITFTRKIDNKLTIEGSSFRDRLQPGQPETWNFSIRPESGNKGLQAALALDMYNKALDAIAPHSFGFSFPTTFEYPSAFLRHIYMGFASNSYSSPLRFKSLSRLEAPQLCYIDQGYYHTHSALKMRAMSTGSNLNIAEDAVAMEESSEIQTNASLAMDLGSSATDLSAARDKSATESEQPSEEEVQKPEIDYRASDVPMALWAPMLTTDADGNISVSFTVPNANTTWVLRGLAWSADMKLGSMLREFVASKPVMVQPNLPRFLRVGDEAEIVASVMNNSDETADITCTVEIFDPVTNAIIDTRTEKLALEAKASQTVTMNVSAPSNAAAIGYRVNAMTGNFSDGEQNVIQILPDETQLIETTPFYLNPGDKAFSMRLPKEKGARISLSFCENPAWTIVSALPGLRSIDEESANSAAAAIFSAAVARGIIKDNPAIGAAVREWLDNPQDSTLVSMLERNQDLKIALLNATPWVSAARSDSERMAQLALIFDDKQTDAAIRQGIRTLQKHQCTDGGWAWGSWMKESSKWITMNILEGMAILVDMGYFPNDNTLVDMVESAVKYIDRETAAANSDFKDYTDMLYASIRPSYIGGKINIPLDRLGAKAVIDRTVNSITANWRSYTSPSYKAIAATALYRNGRKATARLLTSSIAEFGVRSASQGVSFPSVNDLSSYACILEAFALIDPQSPMVDGIRQYLIVRKEATDWGSAVVTTDVVASILSTGSCWTVPAEGSTVTVDGIEIEAATPMERATGSLESNLSDYRGKELVITSSGTGPSYGAVYAQFRRKMTDVKAKAIDDLSIEKVLFMRQGAEWVEAPEIIPVGSRVKVQLTIHTKRNLDYVTIIDDRPAAFSPVDQIPGWMWSEGCGFYRENRNSFTALYVASMRPGTYLLTYEMNVTLAGAFSSGVATIQSQYAPALTAHSSAAPFKSAAK